MPAQHTPGPWTFDDVWHLIKGPNDEEIAAIHSAQPNDASRRHNTTTVYANARLIAAAPELLSALQAVCKWAGSDEPELDQFNCFKLARAAISMTLNNWFELECGTGDDRMTRNIERDENGEGRPWLRVQYRDTNGQWQDRRYSTADREKGARKRLAAIMLRYDDLVPYVQGDCRGASLYVLRKADVNGHEIDSVYNRGVAVY